MARDKAKDDKFFNCGQEHEYRYVANLYARSEIVYGFLKTSCSDNTIYRFTHLEVYQLIKDRLGLQHPD